MENGTLQLVAWKISGEENSSRDFQKMSKSWRKGTRVSYDSAWSKWSGWCVQRSIDPVSCSVTKVADFLTEMFKAGYEYSTINLHRSAISALHEGVKNVPTGQFQLIK